MTEMTKLARIFLAFRQGTSRNCVIWNITLPLNTVQYYRYLMRKCGVEQISGLRVNYALRFPRTSGRVQEEQQVFAVEGLLRTFRRLTRHFLPTETRNCHSKIKQRYW